MARIRSIHPTTLIDPEFAEIPIPGRLLFIYSWTIADDAGNLERSSQGMKMALFPGDDDMTVKRISELTDALITGRFFQPYEGEEKEYLHIRNFKKYQKPDHPARNRFPLYPGQEFTYHVRKGNNWESKTVINPIEDHSTNVPRTYPESTSNVLAGEELELEMKGKGLDLDLEGKGKEGRGRGGKGKHALPSPPSGGGGAAAFKDKGNGNPKEIKISQIQNVLSEFNAGRLDLGGVSNRLRTFGFSPEEINSEEIRKLFIEKDG